MSTNATISSKGQAILAYIKSFRAKHPYGPTIREIQAACGLSSPSISEYNLGLLERDGLIVRERRISRSIRLPERKA
jgi:repressor LexA